MIKDADEAGGKQDSGRTGGESQADSCDGGRAVGHHLPVLMLHEGSTWPLGFSFQTSTHEQIKISKKSISHWLLSSHCRSAAMTIDCIGLYCERPPASGRISGC